MRSNILGCGVTYDDVQRSIMSADTLGHRTFWTRHFGTFGRLLDIRVHIMCCKFSIFTKRCNNICAIVLSAFKKDLFLAWTRKIVVFIIYTRFCKFKTLFLGLLFCLVGACIIWHQKVPQAKVMWNVPCMHTLNNYEPKRNSLIFLPASIVKWPMASLSCSGASSATIRFSMSE